MAGDPPFLGRLLGPSEDERKLKITSLTRDPGADSFLHSIKGYNDPAFLPVDEALLNWRNVNLVDFVGKGWNESENWVGDVELVGKIPAVSKTAQSKKTMPEITREELDAKLQTLEARMDTRVAEVVGRIDALIASQKGLVDTMRAGQEGMNQLYQAKFDSIDASQKSTDAGIKNLKTTFIVTAISSTIAIVLGIAAFNATVLSNMVASFESGKNTMQSINQVSNQLNDTAKRLDELDKRLSKSDKPN